MSVLPDTRAGADLLDILRLRDPFGVLSVYADADPREQAAARPPWVVAAENGLDAVRERVKADGDRRRWTAVYKALERLAPDLEAVLDPRRPGRGRALFATIEGGDVRKLALQVPLVDKVVLDDVADVGPLLVAYDRGRPAGLIVVSQAAVRVVETALGSVEELATLDLAPDTTDWREVSGPAGASPGLAQHASSPRDRFERRLDEHRERALERAARDLERLRARQGWDRLLLAGDPRLTQPLREELHVGNVEVSVVDRTPTGRSPDDIADQLAPELEAAGRRREAELVRRAQDAALSGNAGALGLADVAAALDEGRVENLLIDPSRSHAGARAPDGRLVPEGVVLPDVAPRELIPEPSLGAHLVERALATDARVTPLSAEGAEALASHDGVAALLRW